MDLLKRSSTYKAYLQRIQEYQLISDQNEAFAKIHGRVEQLLLALKSRENKRYYNNIHTGIISISFLAGIFCLYKGYIFLGILNLVLSLASRYYLTQIIKPYINQATLERFKLQENQAFESQLHHSMLYAHDGIDVKMVRIKAIRNAFIIQFATIMVSAILLFQLSPEVSKFALITIATLMSAGFWFFFFKDNLDELNFQRLELEQYQEDFDESRPKQEALLRPLHEVKAVFDLKIGEFSNGASAQNKEDTESDSEGQQLQLEI